MSSKQLAMVLLCVVLAALFMIPTNILAIESKSNKLNIASPLDVNLVGEWKFDENSGTIAHDTSGNNNDGAIHGAIWTSGVNGSALSFDGASNYVDVPNSNSLDVTNAITIEFWLKAYSYPSNANRLIYKDFSAGASSWSQVILYGDPAVGVGKLVFRPNNDGKSISSGANAISLNSWYFITATYDSANSDTRLYLNGQLIAQDNSITGTIPIGTDSLKIGKAGHVTQYFNGLIDEVRIYNTSITPGPGFNFTVSVSPTSGSMQEGGNVQATVMVNLTSGSTQSVSLTASSQPSGPNAIFNPSSGNPTFTSEMAIWTAIPRGTYIITITGTGGGQSHSVTYTLIVTPGGPPFDYAVSVDPTSGFVQQGGSVQATVTVNLTSGETHYVSCSASGLPNGVTVNFNPSSGLPTFTSTMTISASSTSPKGTYTITIPCEWHPTFYTLTVISPGFDLTVSVSPTSGSVKPGGSVQATVMVNLTNGSTQSVSLSASGLPSGANATFNPSSGNPTFTSTMTISTSSTTPTGTYTIRITGTGATKTATYLLTVTTTAPTHKIGGYVYKTGTSQGIAGATITANPGGYNTTTDSTGHYSLSVADRTYTVNVSASGYQSTSASIPVSGADVSKDFELTPINGGGGGGGIGIDNTMSLILILIVVIIALLIVMVIIMKNKKKDPSPTPESEEKTK